MLDITFDRSALATENYPNHLQQELAPATEVDASAYAFLLSSINPWPIPSSLKKRLHTTELDGVQSMNVTCSMSMTFYDSKSKRFYGSTWVGREHHCTIKSSSTKIAFDNFNELVYFFTRINDPCCFIVIELIMNIRSPLNGSISGRLGCGWAIVNPFLDENTTNGRISLFDGSPRRLLEIKGNRETIRDQLAKRDKKKGASIVSFTMWRLEGLLQRALPLCIKENQIVGAHSSIAGLRSTTINYFDRRENVAESCIGADTHGNILDWSIVPPLGDTNMFEHPCILKASDISVTLPLRSQFEKSLEAYITQTMFIPRERKTNNLFGWKAAKDLDAKEPKAFTIQPKLSIGAHNGNTILRDQWHEVELCSDVGCDYDKLHAKDDVEISSYVHHHACALLFKVEFGISVKISTKTHKTAVVVGLALFFPPTDVSLGGKSAIMLNLENDARFQVLCNDTIFSRQEGPDFPQSFMKLELSARNNSQTAIDSTLVASPHPEIGAVNEAPLSNEPEDGSFSDDANSQDNDIASLIATTKGTSNNDVDPEPGTETNPEVKSGANSDEVQNEANSLPVEIADRNITTTVTMTFCTFTPSLQCPELVLKVPKSITFQLKFYAHDEIVTDHALKYGDGIANFTHPASFSFVYEYSDGAVVEELALYLMKRNLSIEVFDSSAYLGTISLPMHLFLRQGKESKVLENLSVDIIKPVLDLDSYHFGETTTAGHVAGSISLSIHCVGSRTGETTLSRRVEPKRVIARRFQAEEDHWGQLSQQGYSDEALDTFFRDIVIMHGQGPVETQVLHAIQWARESKKKSLLSYHVMQAEGETLIVRPWVGQKIIETYSFSKHVSKGETCRVEPSHPGVRITPKITSSSPIDDAVYEQTEERKGHIKPVKFEFAFDCTDTLPVIITVSLINTRTLQLVEALKIQIQPRLRVDRRFILSGMNNESVRKTLVAADGASIRIVDKTSKGVITTNEKSNRSHDADVVDIDLRFPEKSHPLSERFYAIYSHDDFATVHESWEFILDIETHSQLPSKIGWRGVFDFTDS